MKRILFSVCIIALSCTMAFGQASSKTDFQNKVNQLDQELTQNNAAQAQATYTSLKSLMAQHMGERKTIVSSNAGPNPQQANAAMVVLKAEQKDYAAIMQLQSNLSGNHAAIIAKFNDFVANY